MDSERYHIHRSQIAQTRKVAVQLALRIFFYYLYILIPILIIDHVLFNRFGLGILEIKEEVGDGIGDSALAIFRYDDHSKMCFSASSSVEDLSDTNFVSLILIPQKDVRFTWSDLMPDFVPHFWNSFSDSFFLVMRVAFLVFGFCVSIIILFLHPDNQIGVGNISLSFLPLYIVYYNLDKIPSILDILPFLGNILQRLVLAGFCLGYSSDKMKDITGFAYNPLDRQITFKCYQVTSLILLFIVHGVVPFNPYIFVIISMIATGRMIWTLLKFLFYLFEKTFCTHLEVEGEEFIEIEVLVQQASQMTPKLTLAARRALGFVGYFWIFRGIYHWMTTCAQAEYLYTCIVFNGTHTLLGLIGLAWVFSCLCSLIGRVLNLIINGRENDDYSRAFITALAGYSFFLLDTCIRTGVTYMSAKTRIYALLKNVLLISTTLLQIIHFKLAICLESYIMFRPVQVRALNVALIFLGLTTLIFWNVASETTGTSEWSRCILAYTLNFDLKLLITLVICAVTYLDQQQFLASLQVGKKKQKQRPQSLRLKFLRMISLDNDKIVSYLEFLSTLVDLGLVMFILGNLAYTFYSDPYERTITLVFNEQTSLLLFAGSRAKTSWKRLYIRQNAIRTTNAFPDASAKKIKEDVCPICHEGMVSAKVNHCGHVFHVICLRQLFINSIRNCPLCQAELKATK